MEKKGLSDILNKMLVPIGFKKKGNYWIINGDIITKMVNLQKSQFGNYFYINYGYIINSIPLDGMMHIYNRVTSIDVEERNRITFLLDLATSISDEERSRELKELIQSKLINKIKSINSEADLLAEFKTRLHLNDIPLVVKEHFNL